MLPVIPYPIRGEVKQFGTTIIRLWGEENMQVSWDLVFRGAWGLAECGPLGKCPCGYLMCCGQAGGVLRCSFTLNFLRFLT